MFKKIFKVMDKKDISKLVGVFFLVLFSAALEIVGISIILPVISLIASPDSAISNSSVLGLFAKVFNTSDQSTLFIISLSAVTLLFFIKSAYGFVYTYFMNKFSLNYSRKLTKRLMDTYLSMPYEYHLQNNSSTLMNKSVYDVSYFLSTILDLLSLAVKVLAFVGIFVYLLCVSWQITLVTGGLLLIFSLLIIFVLKPKTKKISKKVQALNADNYKFLSQAFLGIKESKISNTEANFSRVYDDNRKLINELTLKRSLIGSVPSHLIEFVGMLGISLSLYLIKLVFNIDNSSIIETFTIFVYAVIKLLPNVISATSIINSFSFYKTSVDTICKDLETVEKYDLEKVSENSEVKPFSFDKEIELKNISFAYQDEKNKLVLNNVNLKIKKNTSVAISGVSGGGKTTLIDVVLGLLNPCEGQVLVDEKDIKENLKGWRNNISYIPQNIFLSDDTIRNNVAFGLFQKDIDDNKIMEALKAAELDEFVQSLPNGLDTLIGEHGVRLSGGQCQRIGIARAFYRNTNIIVFDESTNALDVDTEKEIFDHVRKVKKEHTLIFVSHRIENLKDVDQLIKVIDNKVVTK